MPPPIAAAPTTAAPAAIAHTQATPPQAFEGLLLLPRFDVPEYLRDHAAQRLRRAPRSPSVGGRVDFPLDKDLVWKSIQPQVLLPAFSLPVLSPHVPSPLSLQIFRIVLQVLSNKSVVHTILHAIGPRAAIVDCVITTPRDNLLTAAAQPLHHDHSHGLRKMYKIVFSSEGRSVDTEFGSERLAFAAPTICFDSGEKHGGMCCVL